MATGTSGTKWSVPYASRLAFERDEPDVRPPAITDGEGREQFVAARAAVAGILATGALGGPEYDVVVSITGYANPGHAASRNAPPLDCVGIYVGQKVRP